MDRHLPDDARSSLLASIYANRLVVLCGAGLSMGKPSKLPSARDVAEICFDRYKQNVDPEADDAMRGDLQALADYLHGRGMLSTVLIERLVPWELFLRPPNGGHGAVADFLIVGAAEAALTSNYDSLIEDSGRSYGFDFRAALDGDQAGIISSKQKPLLKFHGCARTERASTVWTPAQLDDRDVCDRMKNIGTWLASNLRQKDLLIVGFWTDWEYLNAVLDSAVKNVSPLSVTVVDPSEPSQLEEKAPGLWEIAHGSGVSFTHLQMSGQDALEDLRRAFSKMYLSKAIAAGKAAFEEELGFAADPSWLEVDDLDNEVLHQWRRDAEGKPNNVAPTKLEPENVDLYGFFHLILRRAGGQRSTAGYVLGDRTIRVLNGAGSVLSTMRANFAEGPAIVEEDVVVAVGAMDIGLPANIMREGRPGDIVRGQPIVPWLDFEKARMEFGI